VAVGIHGDLDRLLARRVSADALGNGGEILGSGIDDLKVKFLSWISTSGRSLLISSVLVALIYVPVSVNSDTCALRTAARLFRASVFSALEVTRK
jgi:hypothetical protein